MKMAKCDLCGDVLESCCMSTITYSPASDTYYLPCFSVSDEYVPIQEKLQYDVCDKCSYRIIKSLDRHRIIKSENTRDKEYEEEHSDKTE